VDEAEDGNGGRSPFDDMEDFVEETDPRRVVDSEALTEWEVPLFSHVRGGPETCIGFCWARPIVPARVALRTVPKSQRSSGSPPAGLYRYQSLADVKLTSNEIPTGLKQHLALHHPVVPLLPPSIVHVAQ